MPSFIFNISSVVWNSSKNNPKKYPINNIQNSFIDLSFNDASYNTLTNRTTVKITWTNFIDKHTNDGLSLNSYTIPYYDEPTMNIIQFGGIPLSRNSANNSNYWQFYNFKGQISAIDKPTILQNTSLYSAFQNSASNIYSNLSSWDISGVTDIRNIFSGSTKFKERIGLWNYKSVLPNRVENMIASVGYDPVNSSIFLQDISSNLTFPNDASLGQIPPYLDNPKTMAAINGLTMRNISFSGTRIVSNPASFKYSGYSTSDLRIAGYSPMDLSGSAYTLAEYKSGNYSIAELDTIDRYVLIDYKNVGYTLSEFTQAGYKPIDLSSLQYTVSDYKQANYYGKYLHQVFTLVDLMTVGYPLYYLREEGYAISQIDEITEAYTILDYKKAGYSFIDISNAGYSLNQFVTYNVSILKENNVFAIDFKTIGYDPSAIYQLGYNLSDLREAIFTISQIENYMHFTDLNYSYAGYSLTDISNAGFPLQDLGSYSPLPDILKQNHIYAYEFKEIGYDITSIIDIFGYKVQDLLDASYTLQEMKDANVSANDLKPIGYTSSQLKTVGYTALELRNATYTLNEIIYAEYTPRNLKDAGYTAGEISNNFSIIELYNGTYSVYDLIDAGYEAIEIYNALVVPYGPLSPLVLVPILIQNYPPEVMKTMGVTLSIIYGILHTPLSLIQQAYFPPWEIKSINLNVNLYNGRKIPINTNNNVTVNDLSNAGFMPEELAAKIVYSKTDISNALSKYRKYIPYPVFKESEIIYNSDKTQVQYNYSTMLPFDYVDPSFATTTPYIPLINQSSNYKGHISLYGYSFGFYDVSNNIFKTYDSVYISTEGWLSFSINDITLNVIRFFPYESRMSIKYVFWKDSENIDILEIQMYGNINGNTFLITIHIHSDGLITFCNGYYNTNLFVPGNISYSNPDPEMVSSLNNSSYYCLPMSNYYDNTSKTIKSNFYDILRIDLRNELKNCGYLARELHTTYSLSKLKNGFAVTDMRNIGYSITNTKQSGFPVFDVVTAYNIDIGILEILFYK
jgi:hypothetical protein